MQTLSHEIELFEAATIANHTTHKFSILITGLGIIISLIVAWFIHSWRIYFILASIVLVFILLLQIKHKRRDFNRQSIHKFKAFVDIFYPAMLKYNPMYQSSKFYIHAPYDIQVSSRVGEDMLEDDITYVHVASIKNESMTVDVIEVPVSNKQSICKCMLTIPFYADDAFECRSYKKPSITYKYHQRLRGYDVFYNKIVRNNQYIKSYEALRVYPDIDQLDVTYREHLMVLSFKLTTSFKDLNISTNKKHLMRHQMFLNKTFGCIHHIQQTLKETYHEN